MSKFVICGVLILLLVSLGCVGKSTETGGIETSPSPTTVSTETPKTTAAPATQTPLTGLKNNDPIPFVNLKWVNSNPVQVSDFKGKVVMLEFWNRFCTRCLRLNSTVVGIHGRYADKGLVVIALHIPTLPEDKNTTFFKSVLDSWNIKHIVALDTEFTNYDNYGVEYTGTFFLVDKNGKVRYKVGIGTNDTPYEFLEDKVKELMAE